MKTRKQSLAKRRRDSAYHVARYWNEPETRLLKINRARIWHGLQPLTSLDQGADAWTEGGVTLPARIPKPKKRATRWRSQAHTGYVRSFRCAFCGSSTNVIAAHVRMRSITGGAQKPDDWLTVPLCDGPFSNIDGQAGCHQVQHAIGEETFWEKYRQRHGQSVWRLLDELQNTSPKRFEIMKVMTERANG